jgi:hypothetical protein
MRFVYYGYEDDGFIFPLERNKAQAGLKQGKRDVVHLEFDMPSDRINCAQTSDEISYIDTKKKMKTSCFTRLFYAT